MKNIPNFHIIEVIFVPPTNFKDSHIKLVSDRFRVSKRIDQNHDFNNIADTAIHYLSARGFNIVGQAESKKGYFLITDTFQSIK